MKFASWLRPFRSAVRSTKVVSSRRRHSTRRPTRLQLVGLEDRTLLSAYVVTTTADSGAGSLRDAITQVNADASHALYASPSNPSVDEIDFNVNTGSGFNAATGVATIQPQSTLPAITTAVIIDGYTQVGAQANTLAVGDNAVLKTVLDGSACGQVGTADGLLTLLGGDSMVRGLVINRFSGSAILVSSSGNAIQGNFLGTDASGEQAEGNAYNGVFLHPYPNDNYSTGAPDNNLIGTNGDGLDDYGERNVISGNGYVSGWYSGSAGVRIDVGANNVVAGNYIGTDASGTRALGNYLWGVLVYNGSNNNRIGTNGDGQADAAESNLISGNASDGIVVIQSANTTIAGNYIGTGTNGTGTLANGGSGIAVDFGSQGATIGGPGPLANVIAFNTGNGVMVSQTSLNGNDYPYGGGLTGVFPTDGVQIEGNSIHDNGALGIDLGGSFSWVGFDSTGDGVTANTADQSGPNHGQNFPVLMDYTTDASGTTVTGTLANTTAGVTYHLKFFANAAPDPTGYGEGEYPLGTYDILSPNGGTLSFTATGLKTVPPGELYLSATATNLATGDTSEFSQDLQPASQPPTAVAAVQGGGTQFNEGQAVYFDATASHNATNTPMTYLWDFGDGSTSSDPVTSHVYVEDGDYTVTLTVFNLGRSNTVTLNVLVNEVAPAPVITVNSEMPTDSRGNPTTAVGSPVDLGSFVNDLNPLDVAAGFTNYTWGVSGGPYTAQSVSDPTTFNFTPEYSGVYTITLSVSDQTGEGGTTSRTINVTPVATIPRTSPALEGQLDPTFGSSGIQMTSPSSPDDEATNVFPEANGKLLVVGFTQNAPPNPPPNWSSGDYALALSQYLPNGTLDMSYGNAGTVTTGLISSNSFYLTNNDLAYQPDGSLLILWKNENEIVRYLPDGSLDPTFGSNGIVTPAGFTDDPGNPTGPSAMALQPDGKILLTGSVSVANASYPVTDVVLERLNADGSPDTSFGTGGNGIVNEDLGLHEELYGGYADDQAYGETVAVQSDGTILVGGYVVSPSNSVGAYDGFVARFLPGGGLDTSFGDGEVILVNQEDDAQSVGPRALAFRQLYTGSFASSAYEGGVVGAIVLQPNGALLLAVGGVNDPTLLRLNQNGTLDTGFAHNSDGSYGIEVGSATSFAPTGLRSDAEGRVLVFPWDAPTDPATGNLEFAVSRYNPDGTPDLTFGVDGTAAFDPGSSPDTDYYAQSLALQADGNILAVGSSYDRDTQISEPVLARLIGQPAVAGVPVTFYPAVPTANQQPEPFAYSWSVDGVASASNSAGALAAVPSFTFTPDTAGTHMVTLSLTDQAGFQNSSSYTFVVASLTTQSMQGTLDGPLAVDQATGDPTVTLQATTQSLSDAFVALFQDPNNPNTTPGFTPLVPPAGATTPIDISVTLGGGVTLNEASLVIPQGIRVQINGGTWLGGSPALTLISGDLTITGATFANSTDAPTILVKGGHLTLRDDVIQESTGFNDAAISVTGGTVDLGTAADPGGNTLNIHGNGAFALNMTTNPIAAVGDTFTVNDSPLTPSSLSGIVWEDFNDDGQVDFGEKGISGVTITLTGTDDLGNAVNLSQLSNSDGAYIFPNLRPGNYTITETPPGGYLQGIDSVGTAGGSLPAVDQFFAQLGAEVNGLNYNFGELPPAGGSVQKGQTAGIGFWNNKNGQTLIKAFNGGTGTQLADWLAATLPNIFGANSANSLAGQSNASVAALFQHDFILQGVKLDAQLLATALNVYATNATLDSTAVAAHYGFVVSGDGVGTASVNVGGNGDAFGVANNTSLTVMDLLEAADAQAVDGVLYNGNATLRKEANNVFSALNQAGGIN